MMTGMSTLCIHGDIQSGKHYQGAAHNPTHPTTRRQPDVRNPFHHFPRVGYVRFAGYK
jgi:hypothetical protein